MRLIGKFKKHTLQILVDLGSTHNFLPATTANRLNCELRVVPKMQVAVANGHQLVSSVFVRVLLGVYIGKYIRLM